MEETNPEENESGEAQDRVEEIRNTLERLLAADDVVRLRHLKGDLDRKEASRLGGKICLAIDGIVLEAIRDKETAEAIVPVLLDKVKEGVGSALPYTHLLQMLAFKHRLEVGDRAPEPEDIPQAINWLREEMDMDDIEDQRSELKEGAEARAEQFREKWNDNQMFG